MSQTSSGSDIYGFQVRKADGSTMDLSSYRGKVLLVVNVASKCGFTPQYEGLEKLYKKHHQSGFEILAFPCNQFGSQEPGNDQDIQQFCKLNYDVTFPVFSKVDVNGANTHPLYEYLKKHGKGLLGTEAIKWNFTKFLIDRNGSVVDRYAPTAKPEEIEKEISKHF